MSLDGNSSRLCFHTTHGLASLEVAHPVYGLTLITVLLLWLMAEGLKRIGANQVALVACIGPISTIALAHFFLGEPVSKVQLVAAGFVLAGMVIISLRPHPVRA
ncbi:MAG: DMT family transporter [Burkholderiales bacterium]